ncbi:MAG: hypothetical protein KIT44_00195 [Opitutaceae bacterium]|nr:hypothetical protein [Opitutaceae bacterium]
MKLNVRPLLFLGLGLSLSASPLPPPEASQFDFWLGEWIVMAPDGKNAGTNRVVKISGGWGLLENWTGANGVTGHSLNTYQASGGVWRQFWVGAGGVLELKGGLDLLGNMVLSGETTGHDGTVRRHRITWTPRSDGNVRQFWESSNDGGLTWTPVFDGLYRRKSVK